ncbi:HD domain-containing protein [archaeon]|nr:MAG: HD domain-containing protein [archaeon]
MESKVYVSQLREGMAIDSYFVVAEKELLDFKTKPGRYLQVKFKDRTGDIWGKCWDEAVETAELFEVGDVVRVRGDISSYSGRLQLLFTRKGVSREESYDIKHFIESTPADVDALYAQLHTICSSFSNEHLRALLLSYFDDPAFQEAFKQAPGAKSHHHNYLGGLIEHTHSVTFICRTMAKLYPSLDKELLLAGALLHDVGKLKSYDVGVLIDITPEGGLFDHVVLSYEWINASIDAIDGFPRELSRRLLHIILSHHGHREWGSPVEPMIPEASVLAHADLLDSQTSEFLKVMKELSQDTFTAWSGYSRRLGKYIYLGEGE